jgi:hypothetical protein
MYDPRDNLETVTRIPLKPDAKGRGLPVPPLIPLVAVISLLAGLSIGSQVSVDQRPTATSPAPMGTPSPDAIRYPVWDSPTPSEVAITVPPIGAAETPPADGLSLEKALAALTESGFRGSSSVVLSAAVTQLGATGLDGSTGVGQWVWIFVVSGDFSEVVGRPTCTAPLSDDSPTASPQASGSPAAAASAVAVSTPAAEQADSCAQPPVTATVILDYRSGLMIQATVYDLETPGGG